MESSSEITELERLTAMKAAGTIDEKEYEALKARVLQPRPNNGIETVNYILRIFFLGCLCTGLINWWLGRHNNNPQQALQAIKSLVTSPPNYVELVQQGKLPFTKATVKEALEHNPNLGAAEWTVKLDNPFLITVKARFQVKPEYWKPNYRDLIDQLIISTEFVFVRPDFGSIPVEEQKITIERITADFIRAGSAPVTIDLKRYWGDEEIAAMLNGDRFPIPQIQRSLRS